MPSEAFTPPGDPPTELGRYRVLSSTAGARVSPICLGGMSIGKAWEDHLGSMSKEQSFKLLDAFYEAGGNFVDTSNNYQDEESELWIGEWMAQKKNRDLMFIATKYTTGYKAWELGKDQALNFCGNHKKSMHLSVRDSLKKLQTDYIDLLYLHWWDWTTSIPEIMDSLHILVQQGKVLYLGISDTPAWIVAAANTYATQQGKTPFSVYQGRWNVGMRDFERDIIPMARHFGMALCPWDVLGSGKFQSKKQIEERQKSGERLRSFFSSAEQTEDQVKMSEALEKVAGELGEDVSVTAVALAYVMQKTANVIPIVGGRKVEHLKDNIKALSIHLSDEQIKSLESVVGFDPGFPTTMVGDDPRVTGQDSFLLASAGRIAYPKNPKPIGHE